MKLRSSGPFRIILIGAGATIIASLPGLMAGALAPILSEALRFSVAGLGTAFAVSSGVSALVSTRIGRSVDRLGATRSIWVAMLFTASVALLIAVAVRNFSTLVVLLVLATLGSRLIEPAANRLLVEEIDQRRLGFAFGLKQSAPPFAAVLAGLSVSLPDWRVAYGLATVLALGVAMAVWPRDSTAAAQRPQVSATEVRRPNDLDDGDDRRTVLILTVAFGLAHASFPAILQFYVTAAVAAGTTPSAAGRMLAVASGLAVATRLTLGVVSDRMFDGHLKLCGVMLGIGAIGFVLLAAGGSTLATVGVVVALGTAWGFNGVFWFTMIRHNPSNAGSVSGRIAPGALIALTLSPLLFGQIAENIGFRVGWLFSAAMAALAAVGMFLGDRSRREARSRSAEDPD